MKILLINDNPVVNKLVTLSSQKTSDELEIVKSLDEVMDDSFDLVVVDDTLFDASLMDGLKERVKFSKSLYICSKDAEAQKGFTQTLRKPFLPTDLVELFIQMGKDIQKSVVSAPKNEEFSEIEDLGDLEDLDDGDELSELSADEAIELDSALEDELTLEDDLDLGDLELGDDDFDAEEISLDDEISLDKRHSLDDEEMEGVLDEEELTEVKNLLDETEAETEE
ncbi:MAG: DNA topoisomerase IV, partial [Epsilonproteobacteria bacterium]|nr:DNA topoisomerase IV [Campylobacterota bacterium]